MLTGWFDENDYYIVEDHDGHIVRFVSKKEAEEQYPNEQINDITDLMNQKRKQIEE